MEQANPQQADCAYVAGLFDGEGYVGVYNGSGPHRNSLVFKMSIAQSSRYGDEYPEVLYWIRDVFGGNVYTRKGGSSLTKKQEYEWCVTGHRAARFLKTIRPYLKVRHMDVDWLLRLWDIRLDMAARAEFLKTKPFGRAAATTKWSDAHENE